MTFLLIIKTFNLKIVVIDYSLGNSKSIVNILKKIGFSSIISNKKNDILDATHLILPGVGHFEKGMKNLDSLGLIHLLNKKVLVQKTPILGICLGMQLMTNFSEEGNVFGLKWINASVNKFNFTKTNFKSPHMGWNELKIKKKIDFFENPPRFYFVHSYFVQCHDTENIFATTNYGFEFTSVFKKDNILGVQFHPEKSHKFGIELFNYFLSIA